jgi:hypothetical protein
MAMRKFTLSFAALMILFTVAAWAQTEHKAQTERITNGPVVKRTTATAAEISWSTDAAGSSIVRYGTSPNSLNERAEEPWGGKHEPNGDFNHSVWVKNLRPNTTYYFKVETGQGRGTGTEAQSQPQEFHTASK